jgi:L-aminopeptidase/D-esterase-like protein
MRHFLMLATASLLAPALVGAQAKPRARDLGIPQIGTPGPLNAITDVPGVEVGMTTIIRGHGRLVVGQGPVRTGVTAVLPRGRAGGGDVYAAWFTLNGNGEMTGTTWLEESGMLGGPVMITNTHSVGAVHAGTIEHAVRQGKDFAWSLPVVAETWDGGLNDINGFHVTSEHALAAIDSARGGPVLEGNVGGGTGMSCHGFKAGTGTSSRRITTQGRSYTVGVLVQCNYGGDLRILGVPIRSEITDLRTCTVLPPPSSRPWTAGIPQCPATGRGARQDGSVDDHERRGSIIVIVATDAPLLPHQLERIARRVSLGMGRLGSFAGNSSGDLFLAFSTANPGAAKADGTPSLVMLPNDRIDPLFQATIEATEEAVVNAMLAAETMTGADGIRVFGLPGDRVVAAMRKYNRMK